jgi:hypothetical protein
MARSRGSGRVRYRLQVSTYGDNSYSTIITIEPNLTGLRGTQLTGSTSYTLVTCAMRCQKHAIARREQRQLLWMDDAGALGLHTCLSFFLLLVRLNLGTEGNLLLCSSYIPLGIPNLVASTTNQSAMARREAAHLGLGAARLGALGWFRCGQGIGDPVLCVRCMRHDIAAWQWHCWHGKS